MNPGAVDKARKLIALTSSSHIEEARTSAYLACKLIRENGLLVVAELPRPQAPPPWSPPPASSYEPPKQWRAIRVKHAGRCIECRQWIEPGNAALWQKGTGIKHARCSC